MKKLLGYIILLCAFPCFSYDAITMIDGSVVIGNIVSVERDAVLIESFQKQYRFATSNILKTNKGLGGIKDSNMHVYLRDGTVLQGKIADFDEEIGLLISMPLGNITIVPSLLEKISDESLKIKYYGYPTKVGILFTSYKVIGKLKEHFDLSYMAAVFFEQNISFVRGCAIGAELSYRNMEYLPTSQIRYESGSLKLIFIYSYYDFHYWFSYAERFTPFVQCAAGPTYVMVKDDRPYSKNSTLSEMNVELRASVGFDILLFAGCSLRLAPSYTIIFQENENFEEISMGVGIYYGF